MLFPGLQEDNVQRYVYLTRALEKAARLDTAENYVPLPGMSADDTARCVAVRYGGGSWQDLAETFTFSPQLGVVRAVTTTLLEGWDKVPVVGEVAKDRGECMWYAEGNGNMSPPPSCMAPEDYLERLGEFDEIDAMLGDANDATSSLVWTPNGSTTREENLVAPRRNVPTCCVRLTLRQKDGPGIAGISGEWLRECVRAATSVGFEVESVEDKGTATHQHLFGASPFRKTYAKVRCSTLQDATEVFCRCFDQRWQAQSASGAGVETEGGGKGGKGKGKGEEDVILVAAAFVEG